MKADYKDGCAFLSAETMEEAVDLADLVSAAKADGYALALCRLAGNVWLEIALRQRAAKRVQTAQSEAPGPLETPAMLPEEAAEGGQT